MTSLLPKESGQYICKYAKDVTILKEGIMALSSEVAKALQNKTLSVKGFSQNELHPQTANESAIAWIFLVDTLNFCFWTHNGMSKWQVSFRGTTYTGYFALCAAVNKAIEEGIPITDPKFYSVVSCENLERILSSDDKNVCIPLLDERVQCLHQVGQVLLDKYEGSFLNCIKESKSSAQKLLSLIVEDFPCFKDEADFQGKRVSFYKRAQILIGDIWACFQGEGLGYFKDIDTIVMFADYRIPQVLVHFGALKYSDELMKKLKSGTLLENGSREEVEIRGCSIEAVEQVRDAVTEILKDRNNTKLTVNSILIDHFLWDYRRKHADALEIIPFHKVKSVYY